MDLKEYILPKHSMIGGWYIPLLICDELITIFKNNKRLQKAGEIGAVGRPSPKVDLKVKECLELSIEPSCNDPSFIQYLNHLKNVLSLYTQKYPEIRNLDKFGLTECPNIQYYKRGQGFKVWHFERCLQSNRCLVFMTFLNDVPKGGTHFKYQDLTTPAEKGLTLIWPTDFSHTHKGQITDKHEKYIITGWLGFA